MATFKWKSEESKLVLLLYLNKGYEWQSAISDRTPEVISISAILRGLDFYGGQHDDSFRSKSSVRLKLANYKAIDPNYKGKALSNVSKSDKEIWNAYSGERDKLLTECKNIINNHLDKKVLKKEKKFIDELLDDNEKSPDINVLKDAIVQLEILNKKTKDVRVSNAIISMKEIIGTYGTDEYKPHAGVNQKPISGKKTKIYSKTNDSQSTKKIGAFVQETFDVLINENKITSRIINNLLSEEWCKETFHIGHSFLTRVDVSKNIKEQIKDENGYIRYWITPKKIKGKEYCVCKEWFEANRKYYSKWLKSFEKQLLKYNREKFLEVLLYIKKVDEKNVYIKEKELEHKCGKDVKDVIDYLLQKSVLSLYQDDRNLFMVDDYDMLYKMIANPEVYLKEGRRK